MPSGHQLQNMSLVRRENIVQKKHLRPDFREGGWVEPMGGGGPMDPLPPTTTTTTGVSDKTKPLPCSPREAPQGSDPATYSHVFTTGAKRVLPASLREKEHCGQHPGRAGRKKPPSPQARFLENPPALTLGLLTPFSRDHAPAAPRWGALFRSRGGGDQTTPLPLRGAPRHRAHFTNAPRHVCVCVYREKYVPSCICSAR